MLPQMRRLNRQRKLTILLIRVDFLLNKKQVINLFNGRRLGLVDKFNGFLTVSRKFG